MRVTLVLSFGLSQAEQKSTTKKDKTKQKSTTKSKMIGTYTITAISWVLSKC